MDGEVVVQDENGLSDFDALRSAIHKAPHRIVFFAFDLLHLDGQDLRGQPLMERRELLRRLIRPDKRSAIQFSDHFEGEGARFFEAAAELGLEGIVSKRAASRYRSGPSRSWLKIRNMVESEFVLLGTDRDASGIPWALLASDRDGELKFAGPAILNPPQKERALRLGPPTRATRGFSRGSMLMSVLGLLFCLTFDGETTPVCAPPEHTPQFGEAYPDEPVRVLHPPSPSEPWDNNQWLMPLRAGPPPSPEMPR
jgi:hypothetical protein